MGKHKMIENYSCYDYEIYDEGSNNWIYSIYDPYYKPNKSTIIIESDEWFDSEKETREYVKKHIDLLESGEG